MAAALPKLRVTGSVVDVPSEADLAAAEAALGIALPPSYRAFASTYGNGLTCGLFMLYVPMDKGGYAWSSSLVDRSADLTDDIASALKRRRLQLVPPQTPALAERLVPFGSSENGDVVAWDPADPSSSDGEFWIYVLGGNMVELHKAASDLGDFLRRCSRERTGGILQAATFSLPATFEPRPGRGRD